MEQQRTNDRGNQQWIKRMVKVGSLQPHSWSFAQFASIEAARARMGASRSEADVENFMIVVMMVFPETWANRGEFNSYVSNPRRRVTVYIFHNLALCVEFRTSKSGGKMKKNGRP